MKQEVTNIPRNKRREWAMLLLGMLLGIVLVILLGVWWLA